MRFLTTLALLSLSPVSPAATPSIAPAAPAVECVEREELPFSLPAESISGEWGDDDWERWERGAWVEYCAAAVRLDCECKR